MAIDGELLDQARAAEARLIDAERDVEVARAEFGRTVRRLQIAGGSLREIAEALGLSHQRVHQIVEGAGGARSWRRKVRAPHGRGQHGDNVIVCSFCGHGRDDADHRVIAGPHVFICAQCVARAAEAIATGNPVPVTAGQAIGALPDGTVASKCGFCGKRRHQVDALAGTAGNAPHVICSECLALCEEIFAEELAD
ncbi:MAG TPA: ClpX C4-type zinc finger protein [Streptosporangiaceae bacterium]|nr:ClpX C4-type zinc finger protein [Streptosporangiaceae bacterium]